MSWDITFVRTLKNSEILEDITDDMKMPFLISDVIDAFSALFPEIDTTDMSWMIFDNGIDAFEVSSIDENQIVMHVHELSQLEICLKELCSRLNCRAFDTALGEFMDV